MLLVAPNIIWIDCGGTEMICVSSYLNQCKRVFWDVLLLFKDFTVRRFKIRPAGGCVDLIKQYHIKTDHYKLSLDEYIVSVIQSRMTIGSNYKTNTYNCQC